MSIRHSLGQAVARFVESRAHVILGKNRALVRDLVAYQERTKSTGCSYTDFAELYTTIRRLKPRYVLELGTGMSTVVIAHALKENGAGTVISMEENAEYRAHALEILPPHLSDVVEIHFSPAVEKTRGFLRGSAYEHIPDHPYDFVFVDGPGYLTDPKGDLAFGFDLIDIIGKSSTPVSALIDSRHSTTFVYSVLLPGKCRYDYIRKLGMILPSTKHDLLDAAGVTKYAVGKHIFKRPPLSYFLRSLGLPL